MDYEKQRTFSNRNRVEVHGAPEECAEEKEKEK